MGSPQGRWEETVTVLGEAFVLLVEGPVHDGRYEIRIWAGRRRGRRDEQYLRAPIRGRTLDDARDRALEALYTHVGLERFHRLVEDEAARIAPGAQVEVGETARDVVVSLVGAFALRAPLVIARDRVLDREADQAALRALVSAHLAQYAYRT
ncbi:MAG: hypothetical protein QN157_12110 [Armatimonadota bacterium]|nr:hypothetical protein [Armatimonadota bacterium]